MLTSLIKTGAGVESVRYAPHIPNSPTREVREGGKQTRGEEKKRGKGWFAPRGKKTVERKRGIANYAEVQ